MQLESQIDEAPEAVAHRRRPKLKSRPYPSLVIVPPTRRSPLGPAVLWDHLAVAGHIRYAGGARTPPNYPDPVSSTLQLPASTDLVASSWSPLFRTKGWAAVSPGLAARRTMRILVRLPCRLSVTCHMIHGARAPFYSLSYVQASFPRTAVESHLPVGTHTGQRRRHIPSSPPSRSPSSASLDPTSAPTGPSLPVTGR